MPKFIKRKCYHSWGLHKKILGFYDFHRKLEKEPDSESDELSTDSSSSGSDSE